MVRAFLSLCVVMFGLSATCAAAQTFRGCKGLQEATIMSVLPGAEDLAMRAGAAIGDTPEYAHWFGVYSPKYAEEVRGNFKNIHRAIAREELEFVCGSARSNDCNGIYAYVYTTEHYVVTLCPDFFDMPTMQGGSASDPDYENGTMEGTIIHEISHFEVVAGTEDFCYSRSDCGLMGPRTPEDAIANADTYQYFAEDVSFAVIANEEQPVASEFVPVPPKP